MKNMIFALLLLGAASAWAADGGNLPVENKQPTPKLVKIGDDTFFDMQDGRVAGFMQVVGKPVRTFAGLRQTENTCDFAQVLSNCRLEVDLMPRNLSVVWVKHPDPSKIGQTVHSYMVDDKGVRSNETDLDDKNGLKFWYDTLRDPAYANLFQKDRLICDSFAWAQNIPVNNDRIKIDSWSIEAMLPNPETGVNENKSVGGANDVVLKKIDSTTLEFESFGPAKTFGGLPPHLSQQTSSLTFINDKNQTCQVSFESSITQVIKDITNPSFRVMDPTTQTPLRNASLLKNTLIYFYVSFGLNGPGQWSFE